MSSYLSNKEADMRKLIRSMKNRLQKMVRDNFLYVFFFAVVFTLFTITTNLSGMNIDEYKNWTYEQRMIYVNGVIDGLKTAEIITTDHMTGKEIWKPVSVFRVYYSLRDYESIAKIMANNLCIGDYELEHEMPHRIVREVRKLYNGQS